MTISNELLDRALALPEAERAALASRLLESLGSQDADPEAEQLWAAELEARLDSVAEGCFAARDWREAIADIRRRLPTKDPP
jgi:putative addiction module component (TIGR02574 family)